MGLCMLKLGRYLNFNRLILYWIRINNVAVEILESLVEKYDSNNYKIEIQTIYDLLVSMIYYFNHEYLTCEY